MKNEEHKESLSNVHLLSELTEPPLYQVIVHNDDFTPMEFVVGILESYFFMDRQQAALVMQEAHIKGRAVCGVFSREIAESKISKVIDYARVHNHPLLCSMESITTA